MVERSIDPSHKTIDFLESTLIPQLPESSKNLIARTRSMHELNMEQKRMVLCATVWTDDPFLESKLSRVIEATRQLVNLSIEAIYKDPILEKCYTDLTEKPESKSGRTRINQLHLQRFISRVLNIHQAKGIRISNRQLSEMATERFGTSINISAIKNAISRAAPDEDIPKRKTIKNPKKWFRTKEQGRVTRENVRLELREFKSLHPGEPIVLTVIAEKLSLTVKTVRLNYNIIAKEEEMPPTRRKKPRTAYTSEGIDDLKSRIIELVKILSTENPNQLSLNKLSKLLEKHRSLVSRLFREIFGQDSIKGKKVDMSKIRSFLQS